MGDEEEDMLSVLDLKGEGYMMGRFACPCPWETAGAVGCEGDNEGGMGD